MTQELRDRVKRYIQGAEDEFGDLALAIHQHQRVHNAAYAKYCAGFAPPTTWRAIPTVPTDVFRYASVFCDDPAKAQHVFRTSGTTHGARGEHHLRSLDVYHASAAIQIQLHLDAAALPAVILAPPATALPDSSLSSMLSLIAEHHAPAARFAWNGGGLDVDGAIEAITSHAATRVPIQLLTTSFALVHTLDAMRDRAFAVRLAPGSVLMTTGGYKGKSRALDPAELDRYARAHLGEVRHMIEYGMTELGSQFWGEHGGLLHGPRWCRVTVHDPQTLVPVADGETGVLRFTDLANIDSVVSVQTSDLGSVQARAAAGDSIALLGRAPGARPRGCSLLVDEMLGDG